MEILTHLTTGLVLAGPLTVARPATAAALVLGSVVPDLDVIGRLTGKLGFFRWHQTMTHGPVGWVVLPLLLWAGLSAGGVWDPWAPFAFAAAIMLHSAMDVSNTYGVALLAPWSWKRYRLDWVFLFDLPVILLNLAAVGVTLWFWSADGQAPALIVPAYLVLLAMYWQVRAYLRRRALRLTGERATEMMPTPFLPWRYMGFGRSGGVGRTFICNALTGAITHEQKIDLLDERYAATVAGAPEYRMMRQISPAYHVVTAVKEKDQTQLVCRDLRLRHFGGRFCQLDLMIDAKGEIVERRFHA